MENDHSTAGIKCIFYSTFVKDHILLPYRVYGPLHVGYFPSTWTEICGFLLRLQCSFTLVIAVQCAHASNNHHLIMDLRFTCRGFESWLGTIIA